jgi:small-conductance mechanosensitive channel
MRFDFRLAGPVLALLLSALSPHPAPAAAPAPNVPADDKAAPPANADTQQLIDALNDPARRAAIVSALEAAQKTAAAPTTTAAPNAPAGAAKPAAPTQPSSPLQPNGLGAQLMTHGARLADTVSNSLLLAVRGIANIPDLAAWGRRMLQDPDLLRDGALAAARLLGIILLALGAELLAWRMTRRFYGTLANDAHQEAPPSSDEVATAADPAHPNEGWLLLRRLPIILMALTVDLVPALAFMAAAILLLATPLAGSAEARAVTLAVANAYAIMRAAAAVARAAFGAPSPRLRLLPASDQAAAYLMLWVRRIALIIVFGYALTEIGSLFGMEPETQEGLQRLISLAAHVMLIVMVVQCRTGVADWLGGAGQSRFGVLRHRLARVWHIYAIILIAGAWIVYAAEIHDGFDRLLRFMLSTILAVLAGRVLDIVLVGALDRGFSVVHGDSSRFAMVSERAARYRRPLRLLLRGAIGVLAVILLCQFWGLNALGWFGSGALGGRLIGTLGTLAVTLGVALALWEAINIAMQVYLDELAQQGSVVRAARLRTIIPLLRNALLITLMVLLLLTALSELGVNIGPLLAGASIFGVALGFGSQKLVQDFITGIFLLAENAMQVGDTVTAAGLSGTVEYLSIRTLRLRAGDGSVHLIPFSSVSTVTNTNRGLGNAAVAVTIDYDEDTDRVGTVLAGIAREMRGEEAFSAGMLSELQLWGVDRVDGLTVTLAGQIACTDGARWGVQREFNRRVKLAFQKEGIRMLPPTGLTTFRHPLDVRVETPEREAPPGSGAGGGGGGPAGGGGRPRSGGWGEGAAARDDRPHCTTFYSSAVCSWWRRPPVSPCRPASPVPPFPRR